MRANTILSLWDPQGWSRNWIKESQLCKNPRQRAPTTGIGRLPGETRQAVRRVSAFSTFLQILYFSCIELTAFQFLHAGGDGVTTVKFEMIVEQLCHKKVSNILPASRNAWRQTVLCKARLSSLLWFYFLFKIFWDIFTYFYSMHMSVCLNGCLYTTYIQYPWRPEDDFGSPRIGVTEGCEPLCECWGWKPVFS